MQVMTALKVHYLEGRVGREKEFCFTLHFCPVHEVDMHAPFVGVQLDRPLTLGHVKRLVAHERVCRTLFKRRSKRVRYTIPLIFACKASEKGLVLQRQPAATEDGVTLWPLQLISFVAPRSIQVVLKHAYESGGRGKQIRQRWILVMSNDFRSGMTVLAQRLVQNGAKLARPTGFL